MGVALRSHEVASPGLSSFCILPSAFAPRWPWAALTRHSAFCSLPSSLNPADGLEQRRHEDAKVENKAMLAILPKSAASQLILRVFAPLLFTSNTGDKALVMRDLRDWQGSSGYTYLSGA